MKSHQELLTKAGEIINASRVKGYCTLALIDDKGYPTASTVTIAKSEGVRSLTFMTGLGSNKDKRIKNCNRASLCFNSPDYNITLVGTAEVLTDLQTKKDNWYEGMENHYSSPEDPNLCVMRFTAERYNLFLDFEEAVGDL
jgi:general stress protein 26